MKKYYVLVFFLICSFNKVISQNSMSDYSYIIVSEQFEFQDEKDKYELNSLIKFLYNKHGFHAFFKDEVPANVRRCDGLFADAEGKPGFLITKVEHVIKDCDGNEIFRSITGKSDIKNYKKAYYEAAREAFITIELLNVDQKEINIYEDETVTKGVDSNPIEAEKVIVASTVFSNEDKEEKPKEIASNISETNTKENLPTAKYSNYSYLDKTFLLRKTKNGYSFYEESVESDDGLLLIGKIVVLDTSINFVDSNTSTFKAHFDASKNLIIEKGSSNIIYKLEN